MKSASTSVKQEGAVEVLSHPQVLKSNAKKDEPPSPCCAESSKSSQDEVNGNQDPERSEEDKESGAIPNVVIHEDNQETSHTSHLAPSKKQVDALETGDATKDETSKIKQETEIEPTGGSNGRSRTESAVQRLVLKDIREKLNIDLSDGVVCVANTSRGRRCRKIITKKKLEEAKSILEQLETGDPIMDSKSVRQQLQKLAERLHCTRDHHKYAHVLSKNWEVTVGLCTEPALIQESAVPSTDVRVSSVSRRATLEKDRFDTSRTYIRNFTPYDARTKSQSNTEGFVEGAITKDLTKQEIEKKGLIYIYWFPGNFGHIKIGLTTRTVEKRLQEWERKCRHKIHLDFSSCQTDQEPIPHVYRVEKLVQAQLRSCRKKDIQCTGCGRCHKEWFETLREEAIALVQKWSAWMRTNPYEEVTEGVWKLKEEQKENLKTLCQSPPPEDKKKIGSTMRLKEREERNRRLSTPLHSRNHSNSTGHLRRSKRLAEKERGKSSAASDANVTWTFNLEPQP
ncbi:MAG: hypothetical protein Q9225_007872 [Loekoesia sp. 1 TL-2023]